MSLDYTGLMDKSQQLSAELDKQLEVKPNDQELKRIQEFLADRYKTLLFLSC